MGALSNFEILLSMVTNFAPTTETIVASLLAYEPTLTGSVGIYTPGTTPVATISSSIPTGLSQIAWGSTSFSSTFTAGTALAVSLQITDTKSTVGLTYLLRYEAIIS